MYKIVSLDLAWDPESYETRPRQMFVTRSEDLAAHVREQIVKLADSFRLGKLDAKEAVGLAQHTAQVPEFPVAPGGYGSRRRAWSELTDKDFPLVRTFDGLWDMLELDIARHRNGAEERAGPEDDGNDEQR